MSRDEPNGSSALGSMPPLIVRCRDGESFLASDAAAICALYQAGIFLAERRCSRT